MNQNFRRGLEIFHEIDETTVIGEQHMVIIERLREFHDDIVFRHYPDIREHTPIIFSGVFLIVLAMTVGATYFGGPTTIVKPQIRTSIEYPALGAKLRLSRFTDRPARAAEAPRAPAPGADVNDPRSPMVIDIDPESGAVHTSAGSIDILGTPINIGSWPLD